MCRSVPQIPAAATSRTTWPAAALGSGRSAIATLPGPEASFVRPRTASSVRLRGRARVNRGEREDDQAVEDLTDRLRRVQDREERVEHREDECAEDRAGVAA